MNNIFNWFKSFFKKKELPYKCDLCNRCYETIHAMNVCHDWDVIIYSGKVIPVEDNNKHKLPEHCD